MFKGPLDALEIRLPSSAPVSAQLALVRTLTEEIERHNPAAEYVPELHEQLGEELERLAKLAPPSSRPVADRPIEILVVDDDEASRVAAVRVLRALGYPCRTVEDGSRALAEHARKPADIVVSDWSMPGMSGLELAVVLKKLDDPPYVILATAFQENGKLLEGVRGGVDDFLHKPIVVEELEVRLLAASRLVRARRAIAALSAG